jgi:hypothetical protein
MNTSVRDDWRQDTEESLCTVYEHWMQQESLQLGSADEALYDESLTEDQRTWLAVFCARWDVCMERAARMALEAQEASLRG